MNNNYHTQLQQGQNFNSNILNTVANDYQSRDNSQTMNYTQNNNSNRQNYTDPEEELDINLTITQPEQNNENKNTSQPDDMVFSNPMTYENPIPFQQKIITKYIEKETDYKKEFIIIPLIIILMVIVMFHPQTEKYFEKYLGNSKEMKGIIFRSLLISLTYILSNRFL